MWPDTSCCHRGNASLRDPGRLQEEYLTRLCFVAAFYEDVYRTAEVRRYSMLAEASPDNRLSDLVAAAPSVRSRGHQAADGTR